MKTKATVGGGGTFYFIFFFGYIANTAIRQNQNKARKK